MAGSNGTNSGETQVSPELLSDRRAADRINNQIALGYTIEFRSVFVNMNFPVRQAFVLDRSLFIDAGPIGEIAMSAAFSCFFLGIDLSDLLET